MKFELCVPTITEVENITLQMICMYYGYELIIDDTKKRYMIISEEDVAYIQKHDKNGLFIIWRKNEYIQYVNDILTVTTVLNKYNVVPEDPKKFNQSLIKGLQKMLGWIPGKTLKKELENIYGG